MTEAIPDEAAPDGIIPSELIQLLIAAEWLENDLHEMELCSELGESGKARYEQLRERVTEEMAEFAKLSLPSWEREQQLNRAWEELCRRKANEKKPDFDDPFPKDAEETLPVEKTCEDAESSLYGLQSSGFELYHATHDMVLCRELGGEAARKHYELCAQTVRRLLGQAPPTWAAACARYAEDEKMFRELVEDVKKRAE